ncbi:MAG: class I adenylate-forming enzyme family protein [Acidimicrobiales bacterium]
MLEGAGDQPMNLASIIEHHDGDRTALIDGDTVIGYEELRRRVAALRYLLDDEGIGADARVAVMAGNEPDFVVGVLAAIGVGAIAVPVRATSPLPELLRKLAAFEPDIILTGEAGRWVHDHRAEIGVPIHDVSSGAEVAPEQAPPIAERDDDDLAFMMLTSGVSSDAKVAMLSHHNLAWIQEAISSDPEVGLSADDVSLGVLPFSHIFGLNVVLLASLRVGASVVLQRRFDAELSLDLIRRHQITTISGAPPMWQRWARLDAPADSLASVRHAASGAAALPIEVFNAVRDRYGVEIAEGYGLTETSPIVTWSRGAEVKPTSVGRPLEGVDVVLAESDGTPVVTGDTGEIVVRSPGVFKGYLDAEELTSAVLTDDGWFWTGDMGVFDDDGYLYIVDRIKDIVIVSGFNVYPSEVESILMEHPAVKAAIVVGTPHGDTGEAVVAHVSGDVTEAELDGFAKARLSRYKCPTEYRFVDELPVAPTGKLIRRELRMSESDPETEVR